MRYDRYRIGSAVVERHWTPDPPPTAIDFIRPKPDVGDTQHVLA
jgi:hypothetical protein